MILQPGDIVLTGFWMRWDTTLFHGPDAYVLDEKEEWEGDTWWRCNYLDKEKTKEYGRPLLPESSIFSSYTPNEQLSLF